MYRALGRKEKFRPNRTGERMGSLIQQRNSSNKPHWGNSQEARGREDLQRVPGRTYSEAEMWGSRGEVSAQTAGYLVSPSSMLHGCVTRASLNCHVCRVGV